MPKKSTVRRRGGKRTERPLKIDPRVVMPETGWRLRLLRYVYGNRKHETNSQEFAIQLGLNPQTYHNYEKGYNLRIPIAKQMLSRLRAGHGIHTFWLYDGDWESLRGDVSDRLKAAEDALSDEKAMRLTG